MTQLSLLSHDSNHLIINIDYDGFSADLQRHEIDAKSYAISIGGYSRWLHEFLSELFGKNIEIFVVANEEGSFKAVLKSAWRVVAGYSVMAGVLTFHGISFEDIEKFLISVQKQIVELISDNEGDTEQIIFKINNDKDLSDDLKQLLIKNISNNKARKGLDYFTKPLERHGYEKIKVSTRDEYSFSIYNSQRVAFKYIPPDVVIEEPFSQTVRILYLSPELNEWKFQGTKDFWAEVQDQDFLDRTKNRLFSELQGKYYIVSGTTKTVRKEGAKKGTTTWAIYKVSELQEIHTLF